MALNERETGQLRAALQEAVVKCSERCLYQSAKWWAPFSPDPRCSYLTFIQGRRAPYVHPFP
jgi:hypothetical protein